MAEKIIALEARISYEESRKEATKFLESQRKVKQSIIDLRSVNKDLNKQLKAVNDDATIFLDERRKKRRLLTAQIVNNENALKKLAVQYRQDGKNLETLNKTVGAYKQLTQELSKVRERVKNIQAAGGIANPKDVERLKQLNARLREIDASAGQFQRNVGNYKSAFASVSQSLRGGLIAAGLAVGVQEVTQAIRGGITTYANFSQQIQILGAVSGATSEELKQLEDDAKRIGETSQFTAQQVAELQTSFARLGFSTQEILAATEATKDFAIATGEDLPRTAQVVATTIRAYGLAATESRRVTDTLTEAFNSSAIQLEDFAEASKLLAPISNTLGISLEESSAAIGILGDNGLSGTIATQTLSSSLLRLADDSKKYAAAAEELGVTVFNQQGEFVGLAELVRQLDESTADLTRQERLAAIGKIVGIQSAKNFALLLNAQKEATADGATETLRGADALEKFTRQLEQAEGAAARTASIVEDTLAQDFNKFNSALEGLAVRIGTTFDNSLRGVTQFATGFVGQVSQAFDVVISAVQPLVDAVARINDALGFTSILAAAVRLAFSVLANALGAALIVITKLAQGVAIILEGFRALPRFINQNRLLFGTLATAIAFFNKQLIIATASQLALNASWTAAIVIARGLAVGQALATAATTAFTTATRILGVAFATNPIGIFATAIGLLVLGLKAAFDNSQTVRNAVNGLGRATKELFAIFTETIGAFVTGIKQLLDGDLQGAFKSFNTLLININPTTLAFSLGKRLANAYNKGFEENINFEQQQVFDRALEDLKNGTSRYSAQIGEAQFTIEEQQQQIHERALNNLKNFSNNINQEIESDADETGLIINQSYEQLKQRQKELKEQIRNTKLSGGDTKELEAEYTALTKRLNEANRLFDKQQKATKALAKTGIALLNDELRKLQEKLSNAVSAQAFLSIQKQIEDTENQILQLQIKYDTFKSDFDSLQTVSVSPIDIINLDTVEQARNLLDSIKSDDFELFDLDKALNDLQNITNITDLENKARIENEKETADIIKSIREGTAEFTKKVEKEKNESLKSERLEQEREIADFLISQSGRIVSNLLNREQQAFEANQEQRIESLENEYNRRILLAEGNTAEQERLEQELADRREEIERESARKRQAIARKEAIIQTALSVLEASPDPLRIAFAVATGLVNQLLINEQQFEKGTVLGQNKMTDKLFALGTILKGDRHGQNGSKGIPILNSKTGQPYGYAEDGEAIMTRSTTQNQKSLGLTSFYNQIHGGRSFGGQLPPEELRSAIVSYLKPNNFQFKTPARTIFRAGTVLNSQQAQQVISESLNANQLKEIIIGAVESLPPQVVEIKQLVRESDKLIQLQQNSISA